jgi:hypothetical protein
MHVQTLLMALIPTLQMAFPTLGLLADRARQGTGSCDERNHVRPSPPNHTTTEHNAATEPTPLGSRCPPTHPSTHHP